MFNFFHKETTPELFWKIDLHSHICPGIDDGSPDPDYSMKLVSGMAELGFEGMVITPHIAEEEFRNTRDTIDAAYSRLIEALKETGISMKTGISAEYRMDEGFIRMLEEGSLRPLPGNKYILVENAWFQEPAGLDGLLYEIRSRLGLTPVLAHPERYPYYHRSPERYRQLADKGVRLQVNLLSLAGHYGRSVKKVAEALVDDGLVSFVGSDLHRSSHVRAIKKYLLSPDYRKLLRESPRIINDEVFSEFIS